MDVKDMTQCSLMTWKLDTTTGKEISSALKNFSFMNQAKVDQIEEKLVRTFNEFIGTHKLYEEELKRSHVPK